MTSFNCSSFTGITEFYSTDVHPLIKVFLRIRIYVLILYTVKHILGFLSLKFRNARPGLHKTEHFLLGQEWQRVFN